MKDTEINIDDISLKAAVKLTGKKSLAIPKNGIKKIKSIYTAAKNEKKEVVEEKTQIIPDILEIKPNIDYVQPEVDNIKEEKEQPEQDVIKAPEINETDDLKRRYEAALKESQQLDEEIKNILNSLNHSNDSTKHL